MFLFHRGGGLQLHTPAKLNLYLEVLRRRDDGYHELETLMLAISIFDWLQVRTNNEGQIRLVASWAAGINARAQPSPWTELPDAKNNLVFRALERLRIEAGVELGIDARLVKRIPAAAGLGGASSDAAAALIAANQLWQLNYSRTRLATMAAEIGSDVPFFFSQGAALCRGRGERIEPFRYRRRWHFVVARPVQGLSTPAVFSRCRPPREPRSVNPLVAALAQGRRRAVAASLWNRLQEPAESLEPAVARLRRAFERLEFCGHQMSGSGTSYFGLCRGRRHALRSAARLRAAGWATATAVNSIRMPD